MTNVVLIGGGGHAKVVIDSLRSEGCTLLGIYDHSKSGYLFDIPFITATDFDRFEEAKVIIAIGDNAVRKNLSELKTYDFIKTVHTSAIVAKSTFIDDGSMILHGSILQSSVTVGKHVIVNTASRIDHDCIVNDYVHIAPGAILCGNVKIGEGTLVGAGSVIIPRVTIGKWAIIGAGAVVTKDIPDYGVAVGNPARVIKSVKTL